MLEIDKDIIYNYYITENHSLHECADFFGCTEHVIRRILKNHKIIKTKELMQLARESGCLKHFGVKHPSQSTEVLQKIKDTCLRKYGCENIFQYSEVKKLCNTPDIIKRANISRRLTWENKSPEEKQKDVNSHIKGWIDNHGGVGAQVKEVRGKMYRKYIFEGVMFDSSWELALWIYAKDHGEKIEREPVSLKYSINGVNHYYFPDFRYKGDLIEIKGNHMIDSNNNLKNFYIKDSTDERIKMKQKCIEDNNVKIWTKNDVNFAINYVKDKYGSKYLKSFKKERV